MPLQFEKNVSLAPYTTIGLGGTAKYFAVCRSVDDIRRALAFADEKKLELYVLGGGSNTVFADQGFSGLVLQVALSGIETQIEPHEVQVRVAAGEVWDEFVALMVKQGWAGLECLSGIPGLVGATPMQNVGAYGREVREVIESVEALNRTTGEIESFTGAECMFGYRTSRFKEGDKGTYIILNVTFRLVPEGKAVVTYPQLLEALGEEWDETNLTVVRQAVVRLRTAKAMVIDAADPNTRSCGSFFLNALLTPHEFDEVTRISQQSGFGTPPHFPAGDRVKVPTAWLVEQAGFRKGYRHGGVGISTKHALALINYDGTTTELLELKDMIQEKVAEVFGVQLKPEPEIVREG